MACESASKTDMVMIFGEITTSAKVDYEKVVRDTCREIGFVSNDVGLCADTCKASIASQLTGTTKACCSATYTALQACCMWLASSSSTVANGCLTAIPGKPECEAATLPCRCWCT